MKKQKLILIISLAAFLLMLGGNVYAECSSTRCYGKIERLMLSDVYLYIATDGDENNLNCTPVSGVFITLPVPDNPNFNKQYAMILAGMTSGRDVGLRIQEGTDGCRLHYPYLDEMP